MLESLNIDSVIENKEYLEKIFSLAEQAKEIIDSYNKVMNNYKIVESHLISQLDCDKVVFKQGSIEIDKKITGKNVDFLSNLESDLPITDELKSKLKLQIEMDFNLDNEKLEELTNLLYKYGGDSLKVKTSIHSSSLNSILTKYYKEKCKDNPEGVALAELQSEVQGIELYQVYKLKIKDKEGNSMLPKIKL